MLPGIPLLALTATVQSNERAKLIKACGMVQPLIVDVSPNKENIMFNASFVPDEKEEVTHLKWIADMVAVKGKEPLGFPCWRSQQQYRAMKEQN